MNVHKGLIWSARARRVVVESVHIRRGVFGGGKHLFKWLVNDIWHFGDEHPKYVCVCCVWVERRDHLHKSGMNIESEANCCVCVIDG